MVTQSPSREAFLSDYGKFILTTTENFGNSKNSKNNFSLLQILFKKEDFHLPNLTKETIQKNMQVKNCLEYKCLISFDKLLQKGFALEDFNLLPNALEPNILAISKISFFDRTEIDGAHALKSKVARGEPISYANELKAYLKYNQFLLRRNKIVKNSILFLKEFSEMKKNEKNKVKNSNNIDGNVNFIQLSEENEIGFNYAVLGYEKLLVKSSHLELAAERLKSFVMESLKDLKKRYIFK